MLALQQYGGIAQLGERLHGMQEVSGSIPLTSTNAADNKVTGTTQYEYGSIGKGQHHGQFSVPIV